MSFTLKILTDTYDTVDELFVALGALGHTGTLNDRMFHYLRDAGYTGSLQDMMLGNFNVQYTEDSINTLFAGGGNTEGYWRTDDASRMWEEAGKLNNPADGEAVAVVADFFATAPDLGSTRVGLWSESNGLVDFGFTAGDQPELGLASGTFTSDMYFACAYRHDPTGTRGTVLAERTDNTNAVRMQGGSATTCLLGEAAGATVLVNNVPQTTQGGIWTEVQDQTKAILEVYDLDMSLWGDVSFGESNSGFARSGFFGDFVLMEDPGPAGRLHVRTALANKHGVTLAP